MEILEIDTFESVFDYLKDNPYSSDEDRVYFLNKFDYEPKKLNLKNMTELRQNYTLKAWQFNREKRIAEIISKEKKTYYFPEYPLTVNQGCSNNQLELIKGILFSAEYNFKEAEKNLLSNRQTIEDDFVDKTYGGKGVSELEELRLEAADCIKTADALIIKARCAESFGKYINQGLKEIVKEELIGEAVERSILHSAAEQMIKDGCSFRQILYCLNADAYEVYRLAEDMNYHYMLLPEEELFVREAKRQAENSVNSLDKVLTENTDKPPEEANRAYL